MVSTDVVCFAKDWTEDPTSCHHVMRALSEQGGRVLWLNSVCTRAPDLAQGRDLRRMAAKVASFAKGPQLVAPHLWVATPLVLPWPYTASAVAVNRCILQATVAGLRRRLGLRDFQLWSFLPTTAAYAGALGESLAVYTCTDEWAAFRHLRGTPVARLEERLCREVDLVFTTSRPLLERKRPLNPETHLASHGVDHAHFAAALEPGPRPAEIAHLSGPIVGFFGLIADWIDVELLAGMAQLRPAWSFVMVGRAATDVRRLAALPNVHLVGRRPYATLPAYARAFDVAVCPFTLDELSASVNPIKLREYLSAGLPVVASDIPEAAALVPLCRVAHGAAGFVAACEAAIAESSPQRRRDRSLAMRGETWAVKVQAMLATARRVEAQRRQRVVARAAPARLTVGRARA